MKPLPHVYSAEASLRADGYCRISAPGLPDLRAAAPRDFDGPGDAWSPEQLLLAAVETCFALTLKVVARASRLEYLSLELSTQGTVDRKEGVTRFTSIILRPRLTIQAGESREKALRVLRRSEETCLVSASLSTPVQLEPEVVMI